MAKKSPRPILHKIYFRVDYKPELKFYTLLHTAAMQIPNYKDWETNGLSVVLHDYVRRCSVGIRHDNFYYTWEYGGTQSYLNEIRQAAKILPPALEINGLKRLGLRKLLLIATNMSFLEISNILNIKFLSQREPVLNLFPSGLHDMSYVAVGKDNDLTVRLALGPMKKEEIPNHIQIDRKHHFAPDQPEEYATVLRNYPDVAVFIDLDISYTEDSIKPIQAIEFVDKAQALLDDKAIKLRDYIFASQV